MDKDVFRQYLSKFQKVNYFGGDEIPLVDHFLKWMIKKREQKKPIFATFITNVLHEPFNVPKGFPDIKMSGVPKSTQKYLNAVRYTDTFLKTLLEALKKNDFLKDTLVVIMGDHGQMNGEHKRFNRDSFEPSILVPLFFYSENEEWKKKNPARVVSETVSSNDVAHTILDMLEEKKGRDAFVFTEYYEGMSLLRSRKSSIFPPLFITNVGAGLNDQVFYENGLKAVFSKEGTCEAFNLTSDSYEDHSIQLEKANNQMSKFIFKTKQLRDIWLSFTLNLWNYTSDSGK